MFLSELDKDIKYIKGVGEYRSLLFKKLNIFKLSDLLTFYPFRYEDRRNLTKIRNLKKGEWQTVFGKVIGYDKFHYRLGSVLKILIADDTGVLSLICYNRNYLKKVLPKDTKVFVSSPRFEYKYNEFQTSEFDFEVLSDDNDEMINIHTNRIVPIYHSTEKLSSKFIRRIIYVELNKVIKDIDDPLPEYIKKKYNLKDFSLALYKIHFPADFKEIEIVRQRLAFDRFFILELMLALNKKRISIVAKERRYSNDTLREQFIKSLPFELTSDQNKSIQDILHDMKSEKVMNRLLMGDVGSGKTLVAVSAALLAVENGYQAAVMAPTEILSVQHYNNIKRYLDKFDIPVLLLTGKQKQSEKKELLDKIENETGQIIIGTHALIQEKVKFKRLGLIVIDEQHRFGVMQRASLHLKGDTPDVLVMTATPIPRSLALTVYGDLDISLIKEMPPGRKPILTKWYSASKVSQVYQFLKEQMELKHQVYVVYPLVSESDKMDLKDAESMYENFKKEIFPEFNIGLIHGQMKKEIKEETMNKFRAGEIDLLVATTVIEVGVDVANASVMVIEHSERFGLAQLHQLRGRIGRSDIQSYCILVTSPKLTEEAKIRMKAMVSYQSGFKLAEIDLELRGPGEMMGIKQTGMPDLSPANLIRDTKILDAAKKEAFELVDKDSEFKGYPNLLLSLKSEFKDRVNLIKVG